MQEILQQDQLYVAVDILMMTEHEGSLSVLLSRRSQQPFAGRWALPGRFVGIDESAETAVQELVLKTINSRRMYMEQLYTFSDLNRDPRGRVISIAYLIVCPWSEMEAVLKEKTADLACFEAIPGQSHLMLRSGDRKTLTSTDLAFDHGRIIQTGITRVQGKLEYTPIAFAFLNDPDAFSLSEVQTVYEAVLGHALDPSNFRRQLLKQYETNGTIVQTQKTESRRRGRPAVLYQWNDRRQKEWLRETI